MLKKFLLILNTLLLVLFVAACGTATNENSSEENNKSTSQVVDESKNANINDKNNEEAMDEEIFRAEVIYIGLADPHTIEVEKDGEPMALQILDPRVADVDFENVESNIPVIIEYYVNKIDEQTEQNILTSFEMKS